MDSLLPTEAPAPLVYMQPPSPASGPAPGAHGASGPRAPRLSSSRTTMADHGSLRTLLGSNSTSSPSVGSCLPCLPRWGRACELGKGSATLSHLRVVTCLPLLTWLRSPG